MIGNLRNEIQKRIRSFHFAFQGWSYVLRTQKNAWIHSIASLAVLVLGLWLGLSRSEWALIILTIAIVWIAEFTNTALEVLVDLTEPEMHPLAKVSKDVSAAAVLVGACAAVLVGVLILGPPLWQRLTG